jgi:hypothetical protein
VQLEAELWLGEEEEAVSPGNLQACRAGGPRQALDGPAWLDAERCRHPVLTPRQWQLMDLPAAGHTNAPEPAVLPRGTYMG